MITGQYEADQTEPYVYRPVKTSNIERIEELRAFAEPHKANDQRQAQVKRHK